MRVSVVIPTLNRHEALARALASVMAQRLPHEVSAEIMVIDNSPDGNAARLVAGIAAAAEPGRPVALSPCPPAGRRERAERRYCGRARRTGLPS